MGLIKYGIKMIISIAFDAFDFFFRIPIIGSAIDLAGGILGVLLWGKLGLLQFGELIDVTDQIDAYVPTLTIIGLFSWEEIRD